MGGSRSFRAFQRRCLDPVEQTATLRLTPNMAVEAGPTDLWRKCVGLEGDAMGIDTFGESGPAAEVFDGESD